MAGQNARTTARALAGRTVAAAKRVTGRSAKTTTKAATKKSGAATSTTKKAPAKKAAVKKAPARKTTAKKAPATTASAKKAPAKKVAAKKAPAKKTAKKVTAKKAASKKVTTSKAPAKNAPAKAAAKKAPAKKAPAKTAAKKTPAKKAPAKKTPAKKAPAKTAAKKPGTRPAAPGRLAVKADEKPWTKAELDEVRDDLLADRARLRAELNMAEHELHDLMRDAGDGAGNDQADVGSTTFERDHEMTLANNAREMLGQTERALARIEDGSYGACESCGEPIGKMRLMAFPRATLCLSCKQREERR